MQLNFLDIVNLPDINKETPLEKLKREHLARVQHALALLGYPVGPVDGLIGRRTRSAWGEFVVDEEEEMASPDTIGPDQISALSRRLAHLEFGDNRTFDTEEDVKDAIRFMADGLKLDLPDQIAYIFATVSHETARTWNPVKEAYWKTEGWRVRNLRYSPYYGRGYVQLTWKRNYERYGELLGLDLVKKPDLALDPAVAVFILVHGFKTGSFTGRPLELYVFNGERDFLNARRCINGMDRAATIAGLAVKYLVEERERI